MDNFYVILDQFEKKFDDKEKEEMLKHLDGLMPEFYLINGNYYGLGDTLFGEEAECLNFKEAFE